MEIKSHSMDEAPVYSCEVIVLDKWLKPHITPYSKKYNNFNVRDCDSEEDAEALAYDKSCYRRWIYADQLVWQMEADYEAQ